MPALHLGDGMKRAWHRHPTLDFIYQYCEGKTVLAEIERDDPPNNSHFSIWTIKGQKGSFSTKRDAQRIVERQLSELRM